MSQVTINEKTFTIQDEPVSMAHAIENASVNGLFEATVIVNQSEFMSAAHQDVDVFDDFIAEQVVVDCPPFGMSYNIVGVTADGHLIVTISQHIPGMLDGLSDTELENVPTDVLAAAAERFKLTGPYGAVEVLAFRLSDEAA